MTASFPIQFSVGISPASSSYAGGYGKGTVKTHHPITHAPVGQEGAAEPNKEKGIGSLQKASEFLITGGRVEAGRDLYAFPLR